MSTNKQQIVEKHPDGIRPPGCFISSLETPLEEIVRACDEAYCDHFIRTLPKGYDTVIGEDNITISGGQKQLLTIARALLRPAAAEACWMLLMPLAICSKGEAICRAGWWYTGG